MEFEDGIDYETVDFPSAQSLPNVPVRNHPTDSNSRSARDALPPLPPDDSKAVRDHATQKQSVPSKTAVVRSQTFTPHDTPPAVPKRKGRRLSDEGPPIPTSPRPRLPGMTPPTSPASPRKLATSSPIRHSMSVDSGIHSRVTPALIDPVDKNTPLSLALFVKRYSNSLPLRIRVDKGFCDQDEQGGISSGDVYTIHFLKHTKMVTIADMSGYTYRIPLNSAVEFALLYDPDHDFNKASRGYTFERAGDIIALKSKWPKVVRALRAHHTNDPKSSVEEKELFVVKGINRTTFTRKSTLKVYSVTNQKEKVLTEDCMGKFTTASSYVHMYVAEILEYVSDQLPLKVAVCLNTDSDDILPAGLTTDAATIQSMDIKTSLIATPSWGEDEEEDDDDLIPVEISINLDIDVTILDDDDDMDYEDTRKLLEDFDPSKIRLCHSNTGEDLYCAVREGHETLGTEIEKPQMLLATTQKTSKIGPPHTQLVESSPPPLPPQNPLPPRHSVRPPLSSSKLAPSVSPKHPAHPVVIPKPVAQNLGATASPPSQAPPPTRPRPSSGKVASAELGLQYQNLPSDLQKEINDLSAEVQKITSHICSLDQQVAALQEEVRDLTKPKANIQQTASPHLSGGRTSESDSADAETRNRESLIKMTHMEIMKLLEAMNLTQYQGMFMKEQIDGEVLAECSDDVLEHELKVTSKLHRTRLIKVITGRYSTQNILDGQDPYVDMIK